LIPPIIPTVPPTFQAKGNHAYSRSPKCTKTPFLRSFLTLATMSALAVRSSRKHTLPLTHRRRRGGRSGSFGYSPKAKCGERPRTIRNFGPVHQVDGSGDQHAYILLSLRLQSQMPLQPCFLVAVPSCPPPPVTNFDMISEA